jgi:hypothetical protein
MTIIADVKDVFAPGQPWIDMELTRIREICASAGDDFSVSMQDALLVALNRRRKDLDGLQAGTIGGHPVAYLADSQVMEFLGPILKAMNAEITLWCLAWTVAMDDNGKLLVDCEDCFTIPDSAVTVMNVFDESVYADDRDGTTRKKVMARMGKVNDVVGRMVMGFMMD